MSDRVVECLLILLLLLVTRAFTALRPGEPNVVLFHNAAWIGSLSLLALGWVHYTQVGGKTWLLVALGFFGFWTGAYVPSALEPRRSDFLPNSQRRMPLARTGLLVLFSIGFVVYLHAIASTYGLTTLITHPGSIRASQGANADYLASFPLPARILFSLGPLVLVTYACPWLVELERVSRLRRVGVIVYVTLAMVVTLERTYLFVGVLWIAAAIYITRRGSLANRLFKKRRRRTILLAGVVAVLGFQLLASFLGKTASNYAIVQSSVAGPLKNSQFTSAYIYASGGLPAFSDEVRNVSPVEGASDPPGPLGLNILSPLIKLVPGWQVAPAIRPFDPIPFPFNAYTWFDPLYRDFGIPGILLGPFVIGFIVAYLVHHRRKRVEGVLVAALMLALTLFAPFLYEYADPLVWYLLAALGVLALRRSTLSAVRDRVHGEVPVHSDL